MTTPQTEPFNQLDHETTDPVNPYDLARHTVQMFAGALPGEKVRVDTAYVRELIAELDSAEHPIFDQLIAEHPDGAGVAAALNRLDRTALGQLAPDAP